MLDLKILRAQPEECEKKLQTKEAGISLTPILQIDEQLRKQKTHVEELKATLNATSKEIGLKKRSGEDASDLLKKVEGLGDEIQKHDHTIREMEKELTHQLLLLPNLPFNDVPSALDPKDNVNIKEVGEKPSFSFPFKNHLELNEIHDLFDFERGAKISGSGWPVYKNMGARLEWALIQYMIQTHIDNGFTPWMLPLLVRPEIMEGSAQLPKFKGQFYELDDKDHELYLVPTAETALNGLHRDEIFSEEDLPKKYIAYTPCFRREAGAAGTNERGLIRTHQFNKVEMFAFALPEESERLFEEMIASAEQILNGLELHYRNMLLVTGDMSFSAAKTVDIEVYLPGQNRYYEVSSVSNCTDFQARRSKIRVKKGKEKPQFIHTLNGSGLATSRLMVALLENHQQEDGSILIPKALQPYLGGISILSTEGALTH